ncbi:MAG: hypothetical protein GY940_16535 [bacterium]|nr:hypothetical protein [bacterium]
MSDKELNLTRKLFAVVERLVHETPVHDIDMHIDTRAGKPGASIVKEPDLEFGVETGAIECDIPSGTVDMTFHIPVETCEILQDFIQPRMGEASLEALEANVVDEKVEMIRQVIVHNLDDYITIDTATPVYDFFKRFNIKPKLFYTTAVKDIGTGKLTTTVKDLPVGVNVRIRENLAFFRRLTVERKAVELAYLDEKEQLSFWKLAVAKTGKDPRHLKITGVYTGIPYSCIETEKITMNPAQKTLSYRFKSNVPKNRDRDQLRDIALFTTFSDDAGNKKTSMVMVKK